MKEEHQDLVLRACGASSLRVGATLQTLWSGYGEIVRLHLEGCERPSVVVKHVKFPAEAARSADRSHLRKVRSYQVETHWYQNYSTNEGCRTPACLAACSHGDEMLIVLEDLDVAGYGQRRSVFRGFKTFLTFKPVFAQVRTANTVVSFGQCFYCENIQPP